VRIGDRQADVAVGDDADDGAARGCGSDSTI
jgi:hypothetical protein